MGQNAFPFLLLCLNEAEAGVFVWTSNIDPSFTVTYHVRIQLKGVEGKPLQII